MKSMFAAALALVLASLPAYADGYEPVGKGFVAPQSSSWTGFYLGLGAGGVIALHDATVNDLGDPFLNTDAVGAEGFFGTVQVGYDYQVAPRWLIGVFADADWGNTEGEQDFAGINSDFEHDFAWTVGGRLGYLLRSDTLVYALAGYTEFDADLETGGPSPNLGGQVFTRDLDLNGWTVGAGLETRLWANWFLKGEYRYADYDDEAFAGLYAIPPAAALGENNITDIESSSHSVRALITYKFGRQHGGMGTERPVSYSLKDTPIAPASSWTGFYLGLGAGGVIALHDATLDVSGQFPLLNTDAVGAEGFFGTVQVGYDYQVAPRWLIGVFADADWGNTEGEQDISGVNSDFEHDFAWTVGGRLGYLLSSNTLVYALAGYTEFDADLETGGPNIILAGQVFTRDLDLNGWTVGAGLETRLWANWFLKGEYRYADYDDETFAGLYACPCEGTTTDIESSSHSVRALVTYKFGRDRRGVEALK